jgi:thiamine-phosphate pyrophosphorylase
MADVDHDRCRLCLVTPSGVEPPEFAGVLGDALAGGDVASLIITAPATELAGLAAACVPVAQKRGVAVLIHNDVETALNTNADGVHLDGDHADAAAIARKLRPERIVGIGGLNSRHAAMLAGDADPDYVFFGRLDGDTDTAIFAKTLALAEWWAPLFQIPALIMGGSTLDSVRQAQAAGIEFVALRRAVWDHAGGARAAVATANDLLAGTRETAP